MLVNSPNILSWFNNTTPSGYLPTAHIRNKCANSHVVWVVGEQMSFYINTHIASAASSLELICTNVVVDNYDLGAISSTSPDSINNYYYTTKTCPSRPSGVYYFQLVIGTTTYRSSYIDIISASQAAETTVQVRFRNTFTKNKVFYPYSPLTTFYQRFRLRCTWLSTEPRLTKEVIFDSDSNLPREFNQQETILRKLLFYQLDSNMIDGVSAMFSHDYLEINGKKYRADSAFSPQAFGRNGLANGEIILEDLALNHFTRV
jgi:hypothetical protein